MGTLHNSLYKICSPWWIFKKGGFGVHSPFVFDLITKVIEEKLPYYRYGDIELVYKDFLYREELIDRQDPQQSSGIVQCPISDVVMKYATRKEVGELLFRLANFYKVHQTVQIGSGSGFSTLYLTSYAKDVHSFVLEKECWLAHVAKEVHEKGARAPVDLLTGEYLPLMQKLTEEKIQADLIYFEAREDHIHYPELLDEALKMVHDRSVMVFEGIRADGMMKAFWAKASEAEGVTVALDLWSVGILLFDSHLHKHYYKVYF